MIDASYTGVRPTAAAWLVLGDLDKAHEFLAANVADRSGRIRDFDYDDDAPIFGEVERTEALDALVAGDRRGAMELLDGYADLAAEQVGYQRGDRDTDPWWPR